MNANELASIKRLADALLARRWTCAVAESCTGGLVGARLTSIPGASAWFAGGIISYANSVKEKLLGVSQTDLKQYGAVSEAVVKAMALGACRATGANAGVSLSGVAGPDGGTPDKPVGTVWIGVAVSGKAGGFLLHFDGSRDDIRSEAARAAIELLARAVDESSAEDLL